MAVVEKISTLLFGVILIVCTLPAYFVGTSGLALLKRAPQEDYNRRWAALNQRVIFFTSIGWRLALSLCFWIRIKTDGLDTMCEQMGKSGRPCVVISNHQSFFDTIMVVTHMPLRQVVKVKMFVSSHIFKMPLLGTIAYTMGHYAVPFKNTEDPNCMELDKEKMDERQKQLESYVGGGGVGGWFPEGRINPGDPHVVERFRAGGMSLAVNVDAEVWVISFVGNAMCWPRKAPLGGRPSKIGVKIKKLCDSTHSFLKAAGEGADDRAKAIYLADQAHKEVQAGVDALVQEGFFSRRPQDRTVVAVQAEDNSKKSQ